MRATKMPSFANADLKNRPIYKALKLSSDVIQDLSDYSNRHPRKQALAMESVIGKAGVDSVIYRFRKRVRIEALFKSLGLYGFFLSEVTPQAYLYFGKNIDNDIWTFSVPREQDNRYCSLSVSVYFVLEHLYQQHLLKKEQASQTLIEDAIVLKETNTSGTGARPPATEVDYGLTGQFSRQVSFANLPENLKKVIQETIGQQEPSV